MPLKKKDTNNNTNVATYINYEAYDKENEFTDNLIKLTKQALPTWVDPSQNSNVDLINILTSNNNVSPDQIFSVIQQLTNLLTQPTKLLLLNQIQQLFNLLLMKFQSFVKASNSSIFIDRFFEQIQYMISKTAIDTSQQTETELNTIINKFLNELSLIMGRFNEQEIKAINDTHEIVKNIIGDEEFNKRYNTESEINRKNIEQSPINKNKSPFTPKKLDDDKIQQIKVLEQRIEYKKDKFDSLVRKMESEYNAAQTDELKNEINDKFYAAKKANDEDIAMINFNIDKIKMGDSTPELNRSKSMKREDKEYAAYEPLLLSEEEREVNLNNLISTKNKGRQYINGAEIGKMSIKDAETLIKIILDKGIPIEDIK
jgi:hypothetical protein